MTPALRTAADAVRWYMPQTEAEAQLLKLLEEQLACAADAKASAIELLDRANSLDDAFSGMVTVARTMINELGSV